MKMKKFIWGILACMALCACSDESSNVTDVNGSDTVVFPNGEAYVNVRIVNAGATTRAADGNYEDADASTDEGAVTNAKFYFYDQNGAFVTKADVWEGGKDSNQSENIELEGNTVIVLRGLTETTFPKYLVTVLNTSDDFEAGKTLGEVEKTLMAGQGIYRNVEKGFIMSTTSYKNGLASDKGLPLYFVTEITENNFAKEPAKAEYSSPVSVYVERLAAKVKLDVDNESLEPITDGATKGMYKLNITVAGNQNDQGTIESGTSGNNDLGIGATDVFVKFIGWGLNATAKDSYLAKNVDIEWEDNKFNLWESAWSKGAYYRSFWGKSYNYGENNYPEGAWDASKGDQGTDSDNSEYLKYITAESCGKQIGTVDYCAENTNTAEIAKNRAAVTSILLKAQVCDKDGEGLYLVRYKGMLFKRADFLKYVLNSQGIDLYYQDKNDDSKYIQIDEDYVDLVDNGGDGKVKVQLKALQEGTHLYKKGEMVGDVQTWVEETNFTEYNQKLAFEGVENSDAIAYNGGLMYYNIPIEHLRKHETSELDANGKLKKDEIKEAHYGVVRNHYYKVTINKLENLGKGIYNPKEVIVPSVEDEKENYYVGATINILSWKVVNQGVGL